MSQRHLNQCAIVIGVLVVCATSGCRWLYREKCCETDLRHTYCICENEAVRHCPCGPDEADFGVKQTTWRCGPGWHPPSPCPCLEGCDSCEMGGPVLLPSGETVLPPQGKPVRTQPPSEELPLKPIGYYGPGDRPNPFRQ